MLIHIAVGGVLGTLARFGLQGWVQERFGAETFPSGTLAVNLLGSLLLGFLARLATGSTLLTPDLRAGLTIGFCGAFTTMSTFGYESVTLLADGQHARASVYVFASVLGCLAGIWAGSSIAGRLLHGGG
ncbi:MAG TPA: fluoride efflux transporter CrcB [Gemmatimonadales bacterium]|nr:fluoride efflux transporter CrcB [Gemmatimonadales bacterium]